MGDSIEQFKTKIKYKDCRYCQQCPLRLYVNNDDCIELGVGNIYSHIIFVLPSYFHTYNKDLLDKLIKCYKDITNRNLLEDVYITRLCKCFSKNTSAINEESIKFCYFFLNYEISRIKPKTIVYFGNTFGYYIDYASDLVKQNSYISIINPICLIYDNEKVKNNFINKFKDLINIIIK